MRCDKNWIMFLRENFPYSIPRKYVQWEELSEIIGTAMMFAEVDEDLLFSSQTFIANKRAVLWATQEAPMFVVTPELLKAFGEAKITEDNTFIGSLLEDIDIVYPTLILLFPRDNPIYDYEGGIVDYCVVNCYQPDNPNLSTASKWGLNVKDVVPEFVQDVQKYKVWINWSGITTKGGHYFSTRGINRDNSYDPSSFWVSDQKMIDFTLNLREIVLQSLLLICSKPDLVITTASQEDRSTGKGFSLSNRNQKTKILHPRVLGLDYAERKVYPRHEGQSSGLGTPKRPHWRRGYIAQKPVGRIKDVPREEWAREEIRVRTCFVFGSSDIQTNDNL